MKKLFKITLTFICVAILVSMLSACSNQKKIVGNWIDNASGDIYRFYDAEKDTINECEIYKNSGGVDDLFFKIDNKRIYYVEGDKINQIYEYKIEGDTLKFIRGGNVEMSFTNANDIPVTPKPTQPPEPTAVATQNAPSVTPVVNPKTVELTAEHLNNCYIEYSQIKNGNKTNKIEATYAGLTFVSTNGGTSYFMGDSSMMYLSDALFSKHLTMSNLENKGTEIVAGKQCTHYYNSEKSVHIYVDESFGTNGICLKYAEDGGETIEVSVLKFGAINNEPGYEIFNFQSKIG